MSPLRYKASLPLTGLLIPLFGLFLQVLFALSLQITALLRMSLSLGISLVLPTIAIAIGITISLVLQLNLALGLQLPSLVLSLSLALDIELILTLGLLLILRPLIVDASLVAYGWFGSAANLGASLTSTLLNGWPDETSADKEILAYVFVATTAGPYSKDQIADLGMMPQPSPPPEPTNPPPPPGAYPPPQAYTRGLASLFISAPTGQGGVQATGHVTVDDSISTGIGRVTGVTLDEHGAGYTTPPIVQVTDSAAMVSATADSPILVTLPNDLDVPIGDGLTVIIDGVLGNTTIANATATSPIVITIADTAGLVTCNIPIGEYGITGLNGTWYVRVLSGTTAELWTDAGYTLPTAGVGLYIPDSASLSGNLGGMYIAKVITPTTVELYFDADFLQPTSGFGSYLGGVVSGTGAGAAVLTVMGGGAENALQLLLDGLHWPTSTALEGGVFTFKTMMPTIFQIMIDLEGNLDARANVLASCSASVDFIPPSISATIEFLGKISANLQANLEVTPPDLSISMKAELSAQIEVIADLVARIGLFLGLGSVQLEIWEYTGPGSELGAAVANGPGSSGWHDGTGATSNVTAAVFGLTNPASVTAFNTLFVGAVG